MVTIKYDGRLGNNMLQYLSAYIFAKKFNLNISTPPFYDGLNFGNFFKFPGIIGQSFESPLIQINNENFLNYLKQTEIPKNHYIFSDYFQIREFIENYESEIVSYFEPNKEKIDGVFLVYRLGDIMNSRQMLPIEYYRECLNEMNFSSGYITSDTPNHPNVLSLSREFGLSVYYNPCPMSTIDYARKFNKLVLSEGTFSWWIGTLSNADEIYCNVRNYKWHGDIFVNKKWKTKNFDWI